MKTILSGFFSFLFCLTLHAQDYTPFNFENVQWTMRETYPMFGLPDDDQFYWRVFTTTDTVINGLTYKNLWYKKECQVHHDPQNNVSYSTEFTNHDFAVGALREEDKRIYFYAYNISPNVANGFMGLDTSQEHLLYDFNASVGDTVFFSNTLNNSPHFTLIVGQPNPGVLEIMASGSWFFPGEIGTWTEGIGSSYGLFGSYKSYLIVLECYGSADAPPCTPCEQFSSVNEAVWADQVRAFPNPVEKELTIWNESPNHLRAIQIFDAYGRLLMEREKSGEGENWTLDVSDLGHQVLVLRILFDGENVVYKKILKP